MRELRPGCCRGRPSHAIPSRRSWAIISPAPVAPPRRLRHGSTRDALAKRLPASASRFEAEIGLQSNLAMAYTAVAGYSDPQVYAPYKRALKLCRNYGTSAERATVLWGVTLAEIVNCELAAARRHAQEFVAGARL